MDSARTMDSPSGSLPSPSPPELPTQHDDTADRARQRLIAISRADASSDLQDITKPIVGEKGVAKDDPSGQEPADQDEVYRKKLISISYEEASVPTTDSFYSNGSHVALPPPGDGHGCPPA